MSSTLLVCLVLVHWGLSCSPKESRCEWAPGVSMRHAPICTAFSRTWLPGSKRVNSSVFACPGLVHAVSRWCLSLGSLGGYFRSESSWDGYFRKLLNPLWKLFLGDLSELPISTVHFKIPDPQQSAADSYVIIHSRIHSWDRFFSLFLSAGTWFATFIFVNIFMRKF